MFQFVVEVLGVCFEAALGELPVVVRIPFGQIDARTGSDSILPGVDLAHQYSTFAKSESLSNACCALIWRTVPDFERMTRDWVEQ